MNNFNKQPDILQWTEAIVLPVVTLLHVLTIIEIGDFQPILYSLLIFNVPIKEFAFTPFFRLLGAYKCYSPMLLGDMENLQKIDLNRVAILTH